MRKVAVFDFDGTLTKSDTLLAFIRFTHGTCSLLFGLAIFAPLLVWMKLGFISNHKVKQRFFSWFYKGMPYAEFVAYGRSFAKCVEKIGRKDSLEKLKALKDDGAAIYVVSASIREWVYPYCLQLGVTEVLCTMIEVADGKVTGRFSTRNCYGQEKVNRLLAVEPHRNEYYLYAFGDSRGDKEILSFADEGRLV